MGVGNTKGHLYDKLIIRELRTRIFFVKKLLSCYIMEVVKNIL